MLITVGFSQIRNGYATSHYAWGMPKEFWASMYLNFTHVMKDLVRLQCYAGLGKYQEEARINIYIYINTCIYICECRTFTIEHQQAKHKLYIYI